MFNREKTRHIDLHLPQSWNLCTTEELEVVAAAIVEEQAVAGRYHPFIWERVKLHIVLSINNLNVLESDDNDGSFLLQRGEEDPFTISTGQLADLCERLNWLNDGKADKTIFLFPYSTLTLTIDHSPLTIQGPPPLLDGYTWKEYRWLTDWMQEYMRATNAKRDASTAQREFLAVLFKPAEGSMVNVQCSMFEGFSPVKWQVILFWWSSLMAQLAKKFPRVFKQQPVGKKQRPQKADTPWDFYNRVTATIQKYIGGLSSSDVDSQPYGVTLQQLEMMADEAAEMEKLKHK